MKLVSLLKTLSYRSSHGVSVDGTSLANHKAKKSNNPLNNSGLCEYVTVLSISFEVDVPTGKVGGNLLFEF